MVLCSDAEMAALIEAAEQASSGGDTAPVDALIARFPEDPRLHFMRGSLLAGGGRPLEAHGSLARAVELAPDFHLARYQLGFFELTSGEVDEALSTWGPLLRLPEGAYLRRFVEGLTHLIRDEFGEAIACLRSGIALNRENEPLNNNIRLLIGQCEALRAGGEAQGGSEKDGREESGRASSRHEEEGGSDLSATSILLGQFSRTPGKN